MSLAELRWCGLTEEQWITIRVIVLMISGIGSLERTHAAGRAECRDECCERGYYHLHRHLNKTFRFHSIFNFSIKRVP